MSRRAKNRPASKEGGHPGPGFAPGQWPDWQALFPPLSDEARHVLEILPAILDNVWPLNNAHKASLPDDIRELSRLLTCQRGVLDMPYWSRPGFISAYLYYFLPWNIIRLARLLQGLPLPDAAGSDSPLLVDLGSGPLSLPIALWIVKKHWRHLPLHVVAVDSSPRPLDLGRKIFAAIGQQLNMPIWPVRLLRGNLKNLPRILASLHSNGSAPLLISAANVIVENVVHTRRRGAAQPSQDGEYGEDSGHLAAMFQNLLAAPNDRLAQPWRLFVEPGTRLGGAAIMRLRAEALKYSLQALAPCVHNQPCPLLDAPVSSSRLPSSWCHFLLDVQCAPRWLKDISAAAGLAKQGLSLSPLLLGPKTGQAPAENGEGLATRIISAPITVPSLRQKARYGCCRLGKCLVANAENLPSGSLVTGFRGEKRDAKSGIPIVTSLATRNVPEQTSRRIEGTGRRARRNNLKRDPL